MTQALEKIGFGGGCHWCTEAVFQSLRGVSEVHSGWVTSEGEYRSESEGVVIEFDSKKISLDTLIEIHVLTHSSGSDHSMRAKYRSAIYVYSEEQANRAKRALTVISETANVKLVTMVLPYASFREVQDEYKNYYSSDPERPFCVNIIDPKLKKLIATHREYIKTQP